MLKKILFSLIVTLCGLHGVMAATSTVSVVDDSGQTITLNKSAQRIVALAPHVVETLYTAGAGNKIVGAVDYSDYPNAAKSIPRVGGYSIINLEAIVALQPDLVIAWETGNSPAAIEKLRMLGIPVYLSQPNTLEDIGAEIKRFGVLAGTEPVANKAAEQYAQRLSTLRQRYQNRSTVRVFYQISEAPLMTIGGKQIITNALSTCGGKNVFDQLKPMASVITSEAVIAADPEAIVTSGMQKLNPTGLDFWKKWPALTATQRNNFFFIDPDLMNRNGPRMLAGTEDLCKALQTARDHRPKINQTTKP
ncbi:MAG: cobalamin-binding protein [Fluviibacter phosphoraccumulans]|jgi:iron complex transport system substrate-binding protein